MDVAAFVFGGQDRDRLVRLIQRDRSGWCSRTKPANGRRRPGRRPAAAGFGARDAAGTLQDDDMVGVLQHDVPRRP